MKAKSLENCVKRALGIVDSVAADFALVGGLAISARTEPRFTRDVDLVFAVSSDTHAEQVIHAFVRSGYQASALIEQKNVKRLATARLQTRSPKGSLECMVDLIFSTCGIEPEIVRQSESTQLFSNLAVKTARVPHLIAMKVLSRDDKHRPQDALDLRALLNVASKAELTQAERLLGLITKRGYHRGKNLPAAYQRAKRQYLE